MKRKLNPKIRAKNKIKQNQAVCLSFFSNKSQDN